MIFPTAIKTVWWRENIPPFHAHAKGVTFSRCEADCRALGADYPEFQNLYLFASLNQAYSQAESGRRLQLHRAHVLEVRTMPAMCITRGQLSMKAQSSLTLATNL